jgi:hypothetical protein
MLADGPAVLAVTRSCWLKSTEAWRHHERTSQLSPQNTALMENQCYVLTTCVPEDIEPCLRKSSATVGASGLPHAPNGRPADPHDDEGEPLAHPGDPVEACEYLARNFPERAHGHDP